MSDETIAIGIDVGGTFTDAIAVNADGHILMAFKLPSTPKDPATAVISALSRIAEHHDIKGSTVCHGTTVGTNTLIERKGAKLALIATQGFTDVIELRRQNRPALYDLSVNVSAPLVPTQRRFGANERMGPAGEVVRPLTEVAALLDHLAAEEPEAVAICCLHAYANGEHEKQLTDAVTARFPDMFVTASHDVCPEFREFERTSTTAVNGYIGPVVARYIERLERSCTEMGVKTLMIVKSNGGLTAPRNASRYPVHLIESGPAAGMIATTAYARATGRPNVIAFDMGGTTAKAGVVHGFEPKVTDEFHADHLVAGKPVGGFPIRSAVLDIIEVGAGGGSIAWIDAGGVPKVGPESAGADPGPACYSRGGLRPTVTDAHAVIGTLNNDTFDGTGVSFSRDLAVKAVEEHIAAPMGWSVAQAAHAIVALAVANMTEMVRLATVRRGLDPRDFSIVASGGAGPLHVAAVGLEVGVKEVVVPPYPGIFSALGAMLGAIRHDLARTLLRPVAGLDVEEMRGAFDGLSVKATGLLEAEHGRADVAEVSRFVDMRYIGQLSELRIDIGPASSPLPDAWMLEGLFRERYREEFGFDLAGSAVEVVTLHLVAELPVKNGAKTVFLQRHATSPDAKPYQFRRYIAADGLQETVPVYRSADCIGAVLDGPMVIDHGGSTVWVPRHQTASIVADGGITFRVTGA